MTLHHTMRTVLTSIVALATCAIASATDPTPLRAVKNEAFGFGERLEYSVGYKFITAGYAVFQVGKEPITTSNRKCYDIRFDVASLASLEFLYKVRDRYRTMVDIDGLFPWRFEQTIREGGYSKDFAATFDQEDHRAITTEGTFKVPPFVHDVVSALYHVRTYDLSKMKKGDVIKMHNFFDRETHELQIVVLGRQKIEVEAGTFNTIVIEPVIKQGGLFKSEGRILIWLSDDERKIPIKVSSKILIGTVDAELTGYKGLRGPLTSKVSN